MGQPRGGGGGGAGGRGVGHRRAHPRAAGRRPPCRRWPHWLLCFGSTPTCRLLSSPPHPRHTVSLTPPPPHQCTFLERHLRFCIELQRLDTAPMSTAHSLHIGVSWTGGRSTRCCVVSTRGPSGRLPAPPPHRETVLPENLAGSCGETVRVLRGEMVGSWYSADLSGAIGGFGACDMPSSLLWLNLNPGCPGGMKICFFAFFLCFICFFLCRIFRGSRVRPLSAPQLPTLAAGRGRAVHPGRHRGNGLLHEQDPRAVQGGPAGAGPLCPAVEGSVAGAGGEAATPPSVAWLLGMPAAGRRPCDTTQGRYRTPQSPMGGGWQSKPPPLQQAFPYFRGC